MPDAATAKTTTTPRRTRAASAPATKPAAPKAAAKPVEEGLTKVSFTLAHGEDTKSFAKFPLDKDADGNATGCVGTVYAPLGTTEVKVLLIGPADAIAE
jgi:hypothetical protein